MAKNWGRQTKEKQPRRPVKWDPLKEMPSWTVHCPGCRRTHVPPELVRTDDRFPQSFTEADK